MSSSVLFWHVKVEKIVNATTGGNAAGGVPATLTALHSTDWLFANAILTAAAAIHRIRIFPLLVSPVNMQSIHYQIQNRFTWLRNWVFRTISIVCNPKTFLPLLPLLSEQSIESDIMQRSEFQEAVCAGIPAVLPEPKPIDNSVSHAPVRKDILTPNEKKLALRNALRYFDPVHHPVLAPEFADELKKYGRIYMYRFRPAYPMYARPIEEYPAKSKQAAGIMLMIQNNLDPAVAQHPHELITYGGNGAVFQNWAQYLLTMKYLSEMTDEQTLVMYSGHPMGLFPSHKDAPRVVVTNGMVIPNYSKPDDWERFNAMGVSQYGQMTAGSYMYIGPQGIVHGTTITVLNAGRKIAGAGGGLEGTLFVTSGLGGMSGAQPKAGNIAGVVTICAEINPHAAHKRHSQGWVDEISDDADTAIDLALKYRKEKKARSIAYLGNIVDLWERLAERDIHVDLGSDQTSLHNPWAGGYYPVGLSYDDSNEMMAHQPEAFKKRVQESLRRHVAAVNTLCSRGMYFFDYGNAFLLESGRAGADIFKADGSFKYPSYVQDIMGPMCFDYGFGPFRWVCTSGDADDLDITDRIAMEVLEEIVTTAPAEISQQMKDNIQWIRGAKENRLVVGSQARILYADCEGRTKIAAAFNKAIADGRISAPVVLGRDHHDVSGTDSPFRETSNIYDGSSFTADMAIHNVIGDSFRGATWVSIHNGGGVGWGEVINGGFGMLLDGSADSDRRLRTMLHWDVNNGISRRSWARNEGAVFAIKRAMEAEPRLKVTLPNMADDKIIDALF
jgi:urocanate hydratase